MALSASKENVDKDKIGKQTLFFILKKIKSYMPYWVIFWLLDFCVRYGTKNASYVFDRFINSIWSLAFLNMSGIGESVLGMGWYIQSMLLVMFILYPICLSNCEKFCGGFAPLLALLIYGYFAREYNNLGKVSQWKTFFYSGTLRLFAAICLGCFAFYLSTYIKKWQLTKLEKLFITIMENMGLILAISLINIKWYSKYDFICLFIFFVCITIQFSEISYTNKLLNYKWLKYAGKYSLLLYLASNITKDFLVGKNWDFGYWKMTMIYLILTVILAIFVDYACRLAWRCKSERKKHKN